MPSEPSLHIRPMTDDDIAFGMELKAIAGWNQTEADWRRMISCGGEGVMLAERAGARAGVVAALAYDGTYGWIAMMLVHPDHRRMGVATRLMKRAIDHLQARGVGTIGLDATDAGRPVYERLGFVARGTIVRYTGAGTGVEDDAPTVSFPMTAEDVARAVALDAACFGVDRSHLLRMIADDTSALCHTIVGAEGASGFVMGRTGTEFVQLGPCVAPNADAAVFLVRAALAGAAGCPVCADCPEESAYGRDVVAAFGLTEQRRFTRMELGPTPARTSPRDVVFTCGAEYG